MGTLLYSLILFGCTDDGSSCQRLSLPPQRYEVSSRCEAEIEAALMSDAAMRADYPMVEARCVPVQGPARDPRRNEGQLAHR